MFTTIARMLRLGGAQRTRSANRQKRRKLSFEGMERRDLMAANLFANFNVQTGALQIEGTETGETIAVRELGGAMRVDGINLTVTNGQQKTTAATIATSQVKSIDVVGLGGDDTITLYETAGYALPTISVVIRGGMGNDSIQTGIGAATVYGGMGRDSISGSSRNDSLFGYTGHTGFGTLATTVSDLDRQLQLYASGNEYFNYFGLGERWMMGTGSWYYITPNGSFYRWRSGGPSTELVAKLDSSFHQDISSIYEGYSAQKASELDTQLMLSDGGASLNNWGGKNEKWLRAASGTWYFITPQAGVYSWDGSGTANGSLVATLDVAYYNDVSRLWNASTLFSDDDFLTGLLGTDYLYGQWGNDTIWGDQKYVAVPHPIFGNLFNIAPGVADYIYGGEGNDVLFGEGGDDTIIGGLGIDRVDGSEGHDLIYGDDLNELGGGSDSLDGGRGHDTIFGQIGADNLSGGDGNDKLFGGDGNDSISGQLGDDILRGDFDYATAVGVAGNDFLYGGEGNDNLGGEGGNDTLYGFNGDDTLWGDDGDDKLYGEIGADTIHAGAGLDIIDGGAGLDIYSDVFNVDQPFVNGVSVSDIDQQDSPACQTLAAIAAAVRAGFTFTNTITRTGANTYRVTLFNQNGTVSFVTVSFNGTWNDIDAAPSKDSLGRNNPEFWTILLLRARLQTFGVNTWTHTTVAQWDTVNVANGENLYRYAHAMTQLTGRVTTWTNTIPTAQTLQSRLAAGWMIVAGTPENANPAVVPWHGYALTSVWQDSTGVWQVQLYNPWGFYQTITYANFSNSTWFQGVAQAAPGEMEMAFDTTITRATA